MLPLPFERLMPHRIYLPKTVIWPIGPDIMLEFQLFQSGISLMDRLLPLLAKGGLFCSPPKLRRKDPKPILGNSEASQGLSIQVQVVLIFTNIFISPSLSLRQCSDRYAFCAGQNLPDKEFCYFRTVIVTITSSLIIRLPTSLTFWHQASVSLHTWSYDFSETFIFSKQLLEPGHCNPFCEKTPFLLKLRGYFVEFFRESCLASLGILYLPTCVDFRYRYPFVEAFPRSMAWITLASQCLVLEHWLEAFSLPIITLKKQGHLAPLNQ